jgi:hypothetical protein
VEQVSFQVIPDARLTSTHRLPDGHSASESQETGKQ